jgi:glycerophosphoryl diester phosphodiesterase
LALGVHGVELDVHQCSSGQLVVIHDHHLKRLAGCDEHVEALPYDALKELDVGSHFSEDFAGESIPLLDEVLDLGGNRLFYDIEIKSEGMQNRGDLCEALVGTVRHHGLEAKVLVSSFNPFRLRDMRFIAPDITTAIIYSTHADVPRFLRSGSGRIISRCYGLKPHSSLITPRMMKHRHSYPILPWTVNDEEEAERVLSLGCCGIVTDTPHVFGRYL